MAKPPPGKPTFTLFRFPNEANKANGVGEFVGSLLVPGSPPRVYAIEADVMDYTKPDGSPGKYFSGRVTGGQDVIRSMMRGAKVIGAPPGDDLVAMMDAPFEDPLPDFSIGPASATPGGQTSEPQSLPADTAAVVDSGPQGSLL